MSLSALSDCCGSVLARTSVCMYLHVYGHVLSPALIAGPLCSVLVELYGCRPVVILGGILSGLGMVASSFAQSITALYLTAGIITGRLKHSNNNNC